MTDSASPKARFREFRERAGLSPDEAAQRMGISAPSVWDIECFEDDLSSCYTPMEIQQFCRVLGIRLIDLFGVEPSETALSASDLVRLIHDECRSRGVTVTQFEDSVGWGVSAGMDPPERLLEEMTLDGLQSLCRELRVDWHRVILGL
jgi:transcriptional regulator with XRE-family HTH domain